MFYNFSFETGTKKAEKKENLHFKFSVLRAILEVKLYYNIRNERLRNDK